MATVGGIPAVNKFRGSLLGCLVGDCLGERFESADTPVGVGTKRIVKFFNSLKNGEIQPGVLQYTDDTAMTKELANSLIKHKQVNIPDIAQRLTDVYFAQPNRGYGFHVGQVFEKLREKNLSASAESIDLLRPAREQFKGSGSYGNGAAMRVTPVGLYFYKDLDLTIKNAHKSAVVTHAHVNGFNGAVLQALAVRKALLLDQNPFDPLKFVVELKEEMLKCERDTNRETPFVDKLKIIQFLLQDTKPPPVEVIIDQLGNDVSALKSVPTAVYVFLAAQNPIEGITAENTFERTMHYAISLGGDTDTIASMAGGICGAYYGDEVIPKYLIDACEGHIEIKNIAELLYGNALEQM